MRDKAVRTALGREIERRGWSWYRAGKMTGVDPSLLRRMAAGESTVGIRVGARIVAALGIHPRDLFEEDVAQALEVIAARMHGA